MLNVGRFLLACCQEDEDHYQEYMRRMAGGSGEAEAGYQETKAADAEKSKKRKDRKEAERAAKKAAAADSLPEGESCVACVGLVAQACVLVTVIIVHRVPTCRPIVLP